MSGDLCAASAVRTHLERIGEKLGSRKGPGSFAPASDKGIGASAAR